MSDLGRTVFNDRYELARRIGRGGMAEVFLARDQLLDRPVAVKVLFPEYATDPSFVERFRREAQSAAGLNHANVVSVYDWGQQGGTYYIVMEYVDGRTLADIIRAEGRLQPERAAEITSDIASALGFAHRNGVIHRDIKPGNILITAAGAVKVADFGIARGLDTATENGLTQAGKVMGTATYFSPEQAQGHDLDTRSDLYSLGVVLYEMLVGKPPFSGDNPVTIAYKQVHDTPVAPSVLVGGIPPALEQVAGRLLAKNPSSRYASAEELRADLRRFREGQGVLAPPVRPGPPAPVVVPAAPAVPAPASPTDRTAAQAPVPAVPAAPSTPPQGTPVVVAAPSAADMTRAQQAYADHTRAMPTPAPAGRAAQPAQGSYADYAEPRRTWLYVLLGFFFVALLAGGAVLAVRLMDDSGTTPAAATVLVPDVIGKTATEATALLNDLGLPTETKLVVNEAVEPNVVFGQDPGKDAEVEKGTKVVLQVSQGSDAVDLPNLVGRTEVDAVTTLQQLGLVPSVTKVKDPSVPEGSVIRQDPPPGKANKGSTVKLEVSGGPEQIEVPNVAGLDPVSAAAKLGQLGFVVRQSAEASDSVDKDKVIRTDPAALTLATKGDTVTLIVSSGLPDVAVPNVVGETEAAAEAKLAAVGLKVTVTFVDKPAGDPDIGRVVSQNPGPPAKVPKGTAVIVNVGREVTPPSTTVAATTTKATTTTAKPTTTTAAAPTTT